MGARSKGIVVVAGVMADKAGMMKEAEEETRKRRQVNSKMVPNKHRRR